MNLSPIFSQLNIEDPCQKKDDFIPDLSDSKAAARNKLVKDYDHTKLTSYGNTVSIGLDASGKKK